MRPRRRPFGPPWFSRTQEAKLPAPDNFPKREKRMTLLHVGSQLSDQQIVAVVAKLPAQTLKALLLSGVTREGIDLKPLSEFEAALAPYKQKSEWDTSLVTSSRVKLSKSLWSFVASFLDFEEHARLQRLNRCWYHVVNEDAACWHTLCIADKSAVLSSPLLRLPNLFRCVRKADVPVSKFAELALPALQDLRLSHDSWRSLERDNTVQLHKLPNTLRKLEICSVPVVCGRALELQQLASITLTDCTVQPGLLSELANCSQLRSVELRSLQGHGLNFSHLSSCRALERLVLGGCMSDGTKEGPEPPVTLPALASLTELRLELSSRSSRLRTNRLMDLLGESLDRATGGESKTGGSRADKNDAQLHAPHGLDQLPGLKLLRLTYWPKLVGIPDFGTLRVGLKPLALESLELSNLPDLTALHGVTLPASLRTLAMKFGENGRLAPNPRHRDDIESLWRLGEDADKPEVKKPPAAGEEQFVAVLGSGLPALTSLSLHVPGLAEGALSAIERLCPALVRLEIGGCSLLDDMHTNLQRPAKAGAQKDKSDDPDFKRWSCERGSKTVALTASTRESAPAGYSDSELYYCNVGSAGAQRLLLRGCVIEGESWTKPRRAFSPPGWL